MTEQSVGRAESMASAKAAMRKALRAGGQFNGDEIEEVVDLVMKAVDDAEGAIIKTAARARHVGVELQALIFSLVMIRKIAEHKLEVAERGIDFVFSGTEEGTE